MGPFVVTAHISEVAYRLDLKDQFTHIHLVFYMSLLCRFVASGYGIKPPEPIEVKDTKEYMIEHLSAYQHGC